MESFSRRRFLAQAAAGCCSLAAASLLDAWRHGLALADPADGTTMNNGGAFTIGGPDAGAPAVLRGTALADALSEVVADLENKFPYASGLFTAVDGYALERNRQGKSVGPATARGAGVSLRVFDGEAFHESATAMVTREGLARAAARLRDELSRKADRYEIARLSPLERSWSAETTRDPGSITLGARAELLDADFERANWNDPRVKNCTITMSETRVSRVFVDRTRRLQSEAQTVNRAAYLFGFENGRPASAYVRRNRRGDLERAALTDEDLEQMRHELVDMFRAERIPAGEYDVVLAPEITGLLAHESFGHGVEMDQFVKDRARAQQFLGKQVASEIVTLTDDATLADATGSYPFDDEGMTAATTTVIDRGIFVSPITDLMSATFLGRPRTPNGRTQSWDRKVFARMSNTCIQPGTSEVAELLDSLKSGLYVGGFRNGIEDPQGWGIQFTTRYGYEVKNGKRTGKVYTPLTVTGYVPEILKNVSLVANDFAVTPGTCGKGFKEFVPVGSGGPHLRTRARIA